MAAGDASFLTFWLIWARWQGWTVPLLHVRICVWLESCDDPERVLLVFRGAAKSTIYAVYKAWRLYRNRQLRSLVWAADGTTAAMLTGDAINVLRNHPLCVGMLNRKPGAKRFWVAGSRDARNPSMRAVGVEVNATGARADDIDFDDIEVPGNIETPEARLKLRNRISESTHIAVPGAQKTFIGTPHHHDSIYPERIKAGASVLKIPLFEHSVRYAAKAGRTRFPFPHEIGDDGLYVLSGIHSGARLLVDGVDYTWDAKRREVVFDASPSAVLDIASGCAWPERFTRADIELRRKETRTLNAWDSQYMLEAKPLTEVRLDPERVVPYDVEPRFLMQNRKLTMWLAGVQIVSMSLRWDPASGKPKSDLSGVALSFQDAAGRHYWHRVLGLTGDIATTSDDGREITGGQVAQIVDIIKAYRVPRVTIETNGIGGFAPKMLRMCLKQRRVTCGIAEVNATENKNRRILEALEPLTQSGLAWAHMSVLQGPFWEQMRDWNPAIRDQPDDLLDAVSGAVVDQPGRVGSTYTGGNLPADDAQNWRPMSGVYEATLEA